MTLRTATEAANFQISNYIDSGKKISDPNQEQRFWRTLAHDAPSCDLISVSLRF